MAEGYGKFFAKLYNRDAEIYSAGTNPAKEIHPMAIEVMMEDKIDISNQYPKSLNDIPLNELTLYVTLCGEANEACPNIPGVKHIHFGVEDPSHSDDIWVFRRVRDRIKEFVDELFYAYEI
ncbi:arsenate reductase ArsC [Hydrogenobaculum acidophilum]